MVNFKPLFHVINRGTITAAIEIVIYNIYFRLKEMR